MTRMASSYMGKKETVHNGFRVPLARTSFPWVTPILMPPSLLPKEFPTPVSVVRTPLVYGGSLTGASFTTLESWKQSSGVVFGAALAKVPVKMQVPKVDSPL